MQNKIELPLEIKGFLQSRRDPTFSASVCEGCSAGCCKSPGFAIFENTVFIYQLYRSGSLIRSDYDFEKGLTYRQFINMYFDRFTNGAGMMLFFPRVLINDDRLLSSLSAGDYFSNRETLLANNKWITNYGCVFLSERRIPEHGMKLIKCILHDEGTGEVVGAKPIDCVFLSCNSLRFVKKPSLQESNLWFALLNYYYPNGEMSFSNKND